jgi:hypothetical protein
MPGSRSRKWPVIATIAVLAGLAVGATAVALVGSAQRRDDRGAYLRYERQILPPLRDGGRIVQQEMKPSLREFADGEITQAMALERATGWRGELAKVLADVVAPDPPSFLGDIAARWRKAIAGYRQIPDLFEQAAHKTGAARARSLEQAAGAGTRADKLFDEASAVMQFHRRRLGLGSTTDLPDPAATQNE